MRKLLLILIPGLAFSQDPLQRLVERDVLSLSLKRAVDLALAPEGNTRVQLAREIIRQAEARSAQARAALLPDLSGTASYQSQTQNLAARGIRIQVPIPGFSIPTFVGPFDVFDARVSVNQSIFDLSSIKRFQASKTGIAVAKAERESATDQTMELVARAYLAALRAQAVVETGEANVKLAHELESQAENQKQAGSGTGIEVIRALVQLANEEQRLTVARNDFERERLQLLRVIGLNLDTRVQLTDRMAYIAMEEPTLRQAQETANKFRAELEAQKRREENASLTYSAVKYERLPSIAAFGDYGSLGTGFSSSLPTRTYGVGLRIPIFDGGRRDARRGEALSQLRQERIRTQDLKEQVVLEIKLALDSLRSAESQVKTAESGLQLAEGELEQAERRYKAGVASGIEVTDAQTRLTRARENRISALFNHNLARIDLGAAMGTVERIVQ